MRYKYDRETVDKSSALISMKSTLQSPHYNVTSIHLITKDNISLFSYPNTMITLRQRTIFATTAVLLTVSVVAFLSLYTNTYQLRSALNDVISSRFSNTDLSDASPSHLRPKLTGVANSTLGFSKIFAVGLPERTDKRDALALIARLTGLNIEWIDGVRGESIPDKAVPFGADRKELCKCFSSLICCLLCPCLGRIDNTVLPRHSSITPKKPVLTLVGDTNIGSWRGHMDAVRIIV